MVLNRPVRARVFHRAFAAAVGSGAATIVLIAPPALADPPNCTAADLAGVAAGVSAATSAYLYTHPDANAFVTGLKGQPRDQVLVMIQDYLDARPQMRDEIRLIRQPLADIRARCGVDNTAESSGLPMAQ